MHRQLTKQALISLLASSIAIGAVGQERSSALATAPDRNDEPSGWIRVEIAIFATEETEALNSEVWAHAPERRYPDNRRWLTRYDEIKGLMNEWGEPAVTVNADGSIEVVPEPIIVSIQESAIGGDDLAEEREVTTENAITRFPDADEGNDAAKNSTPETDELEAFPVLEARSENNANDTGATNQLMPSAGEAIGLELGNDIEVLSNDVSPTRASDDPQVSMDDVLGGGGAETSDESADADQIAEGGLAGKADVDVLDDADIAAMDAVDIFNAGDLTDANAQFGSMTGVFPNNSALPGSDINWLDGYAVDEEAPENETIAPEEAPAALPTPYQSLTLQMLKQGLDKLQQQADRTPINAVAWLQAPDDTGAPVVVDAWQQVNSHPLIQGTVALRRSADTTVNVDIWMNTTGDYLPPRYEALETISAPERVLVIETPAVDSGVSDDVQAPEFIDLRTGLNTDGSVSDTDEEAEPSQLGEQIPNPFRHAIVLSEQRDIREGYVRYIDHPTLQVVAAWRELSFKEVYELGESQRIRRDIDSLTRTLTAAPKTGTMRSLLEEPGSPATSAP